MRLSSSRLHRFSDVRLSGGAVLTSLDVAYETWGQLNADASNAILLCHGYTNHPHAGGDDGWFSNLMGPGTAVDTERYHVICSNMLGSAYGTTGPGSVNPSTQAPYGPDFRAFTTLDMIGVQRLLIDHLGIGQLKAVIGYSYGGHLAYLWGATHPDRMRALVPIAGTLARRTTRPQVQAIRDHFRDRCPGWNGGHYYGREMESGVYKELVRWRTERLALYGVGRDLHDTVGDASAREAILRDRAETWARQFDANALSLIYEAGIGSSAEPLVHQIRAPLLNVLSRSDSVVDVAEGRPTVELLRSHGVDARLLEIDTPYGHAGPMVDAGLWQGQLKAFLAEIP